MILFKVLSVNIVIFHIGLLVYIAKTHQPGASHQVALPTKSIVEYNTTGVKEKLATFWN